MKNILITMFVFMMVSCVYSQISTNTVFNNGESLTNRYPLGGNSPFMTNAVNTISIPYISPTSSNFNTNISICSNYKGPISILYRYWGMWTNNTGKNIKFVMYGTSQGSNYVPNTTISTVSPVCTDNSSFLPRVERITNDVVAGSTRFYSVNNTSILADQYVVIFSQDMSTQFFMTIRVNPSAQYFDTYEPIPYNLNGASSSNWYVSAVIAGTLSTCNVDGTNVYNLVGSSPSNTIQPLYFQFPSAN